MLGSGGWMSPSRMGQPSWRGGSGVRGVWKRLVDGGVDLVGEEMFALKLRSQTGLMAEYIRRAEKELAEEWPEEIAWPA